MVLFFSKNLTKTLEFIVEREPVSNVSLSPEPFTITPDSIDSKKTNEVPDILIKGNIETTTCNINTPLNGTVVIEKCDVPIKSVEIQLIRVETCGCTEGFAKEASEIQNIQIAEGDIPRKWSIQIFMIFPRLFTCPSINAATFKVDFEITIVVFLQDGRNISQKIPVKLVRF
jgi:hypothetical protein